MSTGLPEQPTRQVPVPIQVASSWTPQEVIKVILYVIMAVGAITGSYQINEIKSGHPLPVTPVPPTASTPNDVPVTPISYVTAEDLRKALSESEDRIAKRILDELK